MVHGVHIFQASAQFWTSVIVWTVWKYWVRKRSLHRLHSLHNGLWCCLVKLVCVFIYVLLFIPWCWIDACVLINDIKTDYVLINDIEKTLISRHDVIYPAKFLVKSSTFLFSVSHQRKSTAWPAQKWLHLNLRKSKSILNLERKSHKTHYTGKTTRWI